MAKLGYLVCDGSTHLVPELLFEVSEENEIFEYFRWVNHTKTKWKYEKPFSHISDYEFEIGDDIYDACCPILGIYDIEDRLHLNKMINRAHHQQMNLEDLHFME
jgi:hypothetical protein